MPGDPLTINGSNFAPQPANNVVKLNVTGAPVSAATTSTLNAQVPSGARYNRMLWIG